MYEDFYEFLKETDDKESCSNLLSKIKTLKEEQAETEDSESPVEEEIEENSEELTENELQMLESGIVNLNLHVQS